MSVAAVAVAVAVAVAAVVAAVVAAAVAAALVAVLVALLASAPVRLEEDGTTMPGMNDTSHSFLPTRHAFEDIGFHIMRIAGKKTQMRRFASWFGAEPVFLAITWRKLHKSGWLEYAGKRPEPEHFAVGLHVVEVLSHRGFRGFYSWGC